MGFIRERRSKIISQPPIRARATDAAMHPADLPLDRQHWAGPALLWDAFAALSEVTVVYRRTGRRRRHSWTWGEHLPPSSAVRNSEHGGAALGPMAAALRLRESVSLALESRPSCKLNQSSLACYKRAKCPCVRRPLLRVRVPVARACPEAGPARHGGLWRWRVAWVTDRGFDVMETASFFRAETGDNRLENGAR
jgi:hypothetical protein